jgi:hypothetical protein
VTTRNHTTLQGKGDRREANAAPQPSSNVRLGANAREGDAVASPGSLHAQVPGPPIGFGNRTRARTWLQRALTIAPNDVDANYFMGDLLNRAHDQAGAVRSLARALAAPARPGRAEADRGRKAEARTLLAQVRTHL